jgi:hypothetical protein
MRVTSSIMTRMYWARSGTSTPSSFLHRQAVGVLVAHHRDVVEAVQIGQRLQPGAGLGQLLGGAVQQADVRIGALTITSPSSSSTRRSTPWAAGCCGPKLIV